MVNADNLGQWNYVPKITFVCFHVRGSLQVTFVSTPLFFDKQLFFSVSKFVTGCVHFCNLRMSFFSSPFALGRNSLSPTLSLVTS